MSAGSVRHPVTLVRVLVIEDHPVVREGLAGLLEREGGCAIAGRAGSAREARTLAPACAPDIILLDLMLEHEDGLTLIGELATLAPAARVLVFSLQPEEIYAERCLRAGAHGYVSKQEPLPVLYGAIRTVAAGGIHVSPRVTAATLANLRAGPADRTASDAIGGFSNVIPKTVTLTASLADTGAQIGVLPVLVRPVTLTYVSLSPTP